MAGALESTPRTPVLLVTILSGDRNSPDGTACQEAFP